MPSLSSVISCGADRVHVSGERFDAALPQRRVQHPPGLPHETLRSPLVPIVKVRHHRVQQRRRDLPIDRSWSTALSGIEPTPTICCARSGSPRIFTRAMNALDRPSQDIGSPLLRQVAVEHRLDGPSLLVGIQLLPRDVLDRRSAASVSTPHDDGNLSQSKPGRGGDAMEAGDELEPACLA